MKTLPKKLKKAQNNCRNNDNINHWYIDLFCNFKRYLFQYGQGYY